MAIMEIVDNGVNTPLSLLAISQSQDISLSYLEQIFARLKKSGIVDSIKGPKGGYILAKNAEEITIAQIIKAIGEPIKMTRCTSENKGCMKSKVKCKTHHLWQGLEGKIYDYLDSISLKTL
jgi:Rrf2 family iron-sulfur cluster assembly transcriptional regulator